ncbi:DUF4258 domain-containing protein [Iodobacter fluviatilis]|uniref:Uncharacterized protein DUF4258 n=1 Tax=Iodobacter fluviatilis TaxID=537 RepID=A0A377Q5P7_9NEIS|nr:DUF4258 domain-containing protein [Iodobacter fluviatilis]TCU84610.1 uncharacterized protein DUF4258 [Iodobacter fluviatilis]STQ90075.1 Uncharacterised protein [Iodobacter fluviatilis]
MTMGVEIQTMTHLEAMQTIKAAFSSGDNFVTTSHASERMAEREISLHMIRHAGKNGHLQRPPVFNEAHKNFECRIQNYCAGMNYVVCVALSKNDDGVIVITVWEVSEE